MIAAFVAALALACGAFAYYTSTGSGTASANVGDAQAVTITAGSIAPDDALFPGGSADVRGTISNPNGFLVHIGRLNIDTSQGTAGFDADGSHSSCNLGSLSFTASHSVQTNGGAGWDVPASGTTNFHLTGSAVTMDTTAASACQGATFTVYLQATPG